MANQTGSDDFVTLPPDQRRRLLLRGALKNAATDRILFTVSSKNENELNNIKLLVEICNREGTCKLNNPFGNLIVRARSMGAFSCSSEIYLENQTGSSGKIAFPNKEEERRNDAVISRGPNVIANGAKANINDPIDCSTFRVTSNNSQIAVINIYRAIYEWEIRIYCSIDHYFLLLILVYAIRLASARSEMIDHLPENGGCDYRCYCDDCRQEALKYSDTLALDNHKHMFIRYSSYSKETCSRRFDLFDAVDSQMIATIALNASGTAHFTYLNGFRVFTAYNVLTDGRMDVKSDDCNGTIVGCFAKNIFYNKNGVKIMELERHRNRRCDDIYLKVYDPVSKAHKPNYPVKLSSVHEMALIAVAKDMDCDLKLLVLAFVMRLIGRKHNKFGEVAQSAPVMEYREQRHHSNEATHLRLK